MNYFPSKILPWQIRGRWFQLFVESDGSDVTVTTSDIAETSYYSTDNTIILPAGVRVVDVKMDMSVEEAENSNVWFQHRTRLYEDATIGIELPNVAHWDSGYIYIFAYTD